MDELNRQFEERYLLVLEDEERLYESIIGITKEFTEGKIPMDLYVKSLDIANAVVQEIHSKRSVLDRLIKQIRYHLFKMKEYIEINYEDGMDFVIVPNQVYVDQYKAFLTRSHYFIKEWNQFEKEHGLCLPEMKSEIRSFELVFKMINLITDEYDAHVYPDQKLLHIYTLARELPGLLLGARDLALDMDPKIIADQYFMKKYLNKPSPYTSRNTREFEFKQARANGYPDFEYVREPGFKPEFKPEFNPEFKSEFKPGFANNFGTDQRRHHDLVPQSQMHQLMTGNIDQFQSSQFGERHPLQTTGQMGLQPTMENTPRGRPTEQPTIYSATGRRPRSEQPVMPRSLTAGSITPPGPKMDRDDETR